MNTKSKISLILLGAMLLVFALLVANIILNFRDYGIRSIENKVNVVAETIKHSLTSHMVNGVIDNRQLFLSQIMELENIDDLWLVRGQKVIEQYGKGFNNEVIRDSIDREVIEKGVAKQVIDENLFGGSTFRVTIPYKAASDGAINCMTCHDAKEGEILGAISMSMNIDDLKAVGIQTITNTILIICFLAIFILIFVNKLVSPYLKIFEGIKFVMEKAKIGDYSKRLGIYGGKDEREVQAAINELLEKLQHSLTNIEEKISIFVSNQKRKEQDPLMEVQNTVLRLTDIYKFRRTIEHDEKIDEVYARIAHILRTTFEMKDFNFLEADTTLKNVKVVYIEKQLHCSAEQRGCRADRTNTVVDSTQFDCMCDRFNSSEKFEYICVPYSISNDLDFIISIACEDKKEAKRVRSLLPCIEDYINNSKSEIVSKKLTEMLERSARTDALTGLFNRKYLEESIDKIVSQAKRIDVSYGILMCDIDYFKMINDNYGHDVGDEAIKIISKTLLENVRESDVAIRYGGEEFIVLLYNCDSAFVQEVAEKIRLSFADKKIPANGSTFSKTISIGASMYPNHTDNFWQCIKYADIALYHAKESGRNRVVLFDESLVEGGDLKDVY